MNKKSVLDEKDWEAFMEQASAKQLMEAILQLDPHVEDTIRYKLIQKLIMLENSGER